MDVKVEKMLTYRITVDLDEMMARDLRGAMYNSDLETYDKFQGLYNALCKIENEEI